MCSRVFPLAFVSLGNGDSRNAGSGQVGRQQPGGVTAIQVSAGDRMDQDVSLSGQRTPYRLALSPGTTAAAKAAAVPAFSQ